jgi:tRNA (cytidine/uridine-2'-O-)-methyltransferase
MQISNLQRFLHVVLYQPEIPDNTGNVGRTCVAVGAKLWLVRPLGFRLDDRHLRRAGLDYWQHLDCEAVDDWAALLDGLQREKGTGPICAPTNADQRRPTLRVGARSVPGWCTPVGGSRKLAPSLFPALWLFSKHATRPYTDARFSSGDAIIFGSESAGLPRSLLDAHPDRCLRIPMSAQARSLNLAVSVAVAAYEAVRQLAAGR